MYGQRRPEFDPDQILRSLQQGWSNFRGRLPAGGVGILLFAVFGVLALVWLSTGIYQVGPTEQAVTRFFGKFSGIHSPGLHWYYPSPVGTRDIITVLETQTMEMGFRGQRGVPLESEMITGDLNIVDVQMVVQYRIISPEKFLFNVSDPGDADRDPRLGRPDGRTLKDATEAALRQVVGQRSIDDPLFVNKEAVQADTQRELQKILDLYDTGIIILQVVLQTVRPPDAVQDAFEDVVRARVDKESRINEALAYEQDRLPRANGAAQQVMQAAEAFKAARLARARGEAKEFLSVLEEYEKSKDVTRRRLYLEAMEDILPNISIFLVDSDVGGVLPFLPLTPEGDPTGGR
jgi:membrane protease subunit HflK